MTYRSILSPGFLMRGRPTPRGERRQYAAKPSPPSAQRLASPASMPSMSFTARSQRAALALVFLAACSGSQPDTPAVTPTSSPPVEDPEPTTDTSSFLDILAGQPTEILLDGKPIGTTPIQGYKVSPGSHDVTFIDEANGNRTMGVEVGPGDSKTVQSDPMPPANETMKGDPKAEKDKKK
jgi:hypothetical protein